MAMTVREQILIAARRLAAEQSPDQLSLAKVARAAGVSWPTVRRYVGDKARLKEFLAGERDEPTSSEQDTRSRILGAARQVFAEQGYLGATLDEVAAAAGLTKGAIYWHFASKSDLFLALLEAYCQEQVALLPKAFERASSAEDPVARLSALLLELLPAGQDQVMPRLLAEFMASSRDPQVRNHLRSVLRDSRQLVCAFVRQVQEERRLAHDVDPMMVAILFSAVLQGLLQLSLLDDEELNLATLAPALAALLWNGLAPTEDTGGFEEQRRQERSVSRTDVPGQRV
jgi:AcrR family transcriptional regulator